MTNLCMVDLETLDTKPTAVILSIGAVIFNKDGLHKAKFYLPVDKYSCLYKGMTVSESTDKFWQKQSPEARKVLTDPNRVDITTALKALQNYVYKTCKTTKNVHLVGNSCRFDMGILENAYNVCGLKPFWNPFKELDYRTFKNLKEIDGKPKPEIKRGQGVHHCSLDDAVAQAEHAIELNEYYGGILF